MRTGLAALIVLCFATSLLSVACDKSGHPSKTANDINGALAEPGKVNTAPSDAGKPKPVHDVNKALKKPAEINTSPDAK